MPAIPIAIALSLAAQVAPQTQVSPDTLVTFACQESGNPTCSVLDPLAIHDNDTGRSYVSETREEATAIATKLLSRGHNLDLGIMQINSGNLRRVGMSVHESFDPKVSMRAGGAILLDAYQTCHGDAARTRQERATALRCASSVYNTGTTHRGLTNGYTARIIKVAMQVVPSIKELLPDFPDAAPGTSVEARLTTTTATTQAIVPDNILRPSNLLAGVGTQSGQRELLSNGWDTKE